MDGLSFIDLERQRQEDDEYNRRQAAQAAMVENARQFRLMQGQSTGQFVFGLGSADEGLGEYSQAPSYQGHQGQERKTHSREWKYHPAHERYYVYDNECYLIMPANQRKPRMKYELTPHEYEQIAVIREDWAHIAQPGRRMDQEILSGLANTLFGSNVEVSFSQGVPKFNQHSYDRLIDRDRMNAFLCGILWGELSEMLQKEMLPKSYQSFFHGLTGSFETKGKLSDALAWEHVLSEFMVMDYAQRACGLPELIDYKNILLFVRSCGGFFFETPSKLIVYDYPIELSVSSEFGPKAVLHNMEGPAIKYADGSGFFAIEGFDFERSMIEHPDTITVKQIEAEENMERRRIMTDLMGISRYLHETNAKVLEMDMVRVMTVGDDDRAMPRALIQADDGRLFLCGTDGSTKRVYYMPVPRDVTSCRMAHEAIAGPVGSRRVTLKSPNRGWNPQLDLGLDEKDCIAQS